MENIRKTIIHIWWQLNINKTKGTNNRDTDIITVSNKYVECSYNSSFVEWFKFFELLQYAKSWAKRNSQSLQVCIFHHSQLSQTDVLTSETLQRAISRHKWILSIRENVVKQHPNMLWWLHSSVLVQMQLVVKGPIERQGRLWRWMGRQRHIWTRTRTTNKITLCVIVPTSNRESTHTEALRLTTKLIYCMH